MNQKELAKRLAQRLKISERLAGFLVKAFAEEIAEALVRGEKVSLRNFGSFRVKRSASRAFARARGLQAGQGLATSWASSPVKERGAAGVWRESSAQTSPSPWPGRGTTLLRVPGRPRVS